MNSELSLTISLTESEAQQLLRLVDVGVKSAGLPSVALAHLINQKIQASYAEAKQGISLIRVDEDCKQTHIT